LCWHYVPLADHDVRCPRRNGNLGVHFPLVGPQVPHLFGIIRQRPQPFVGGMCFLLGIEAGLGMELALKQLAAVALSPPAVDSLVLLTGPRMAKIDEFGTFVPQSLGIGWDACR